MAKTDPRESYLGRFWLPFQGEETAIPGVMEFGVEGATVRLLDAITPTGLLDDAVVYARLQDHPGVATLFNCFASAMKRGDGQVVSSKIESTMVALGTLSEHLDGYGVEFTLAGSAQWFHERTFEFDTTKRPAILVRFKDFQSTTYDLGNGLTLERYYSAQIPLMGWGDEHLQIYRPMQFRLTSRQRLTSDEWWDLKMRLRRFFELLAQQHMPLSNLSMFGKKIPGQGRPDIQIRQSSVFAVRPGKFEWDEQLLKYHEIQDRLPSLLAKWFVVHKTHPEPFSRYFDAFDRDRSDSVLHFLWNFSAVEELHKIRTSRLTGKSFVMLDRLKDLRERWSATMTPSPTDEVLKQIKNTRDYYAHGAANLRENTVIDWALFRYGDFLAALANLEMLSLLGLSDEEIISLSKNYWMRETLGLHKYPE